jgi:hypothetical protein
MGTSAQETAEPEEVEMLGSGSRIRPLKVWARDARVSLCLLLWALLASMYCLHLLSTPPPVLSTHGNTRYDSTHNIADSSSNSAPNTIGSGTHLRSMHELVEAKAAAAERGMGYECVPLSLSLSVCVCVCVHLPYTH